jgi:hypothetical protein
VLHWQCSDFDLDICFTSLVLSDLSVPCVYVLSCLRDAHRSLTMKRHHL